MDLLELRRQGFHIVLSLEPTPLHVMPTLISKIKPLTLFECKHKLCYSMLFFAFHWCKWKSNHGEWCHHVFKSFSCTSMRWKIWLSITQCECLAMTMQKILERWCALEWFNLYGIVKCHLTLVLLPFT